jgi:hypothetical protein
MTNKTELITLHSELVAKFNKPFIGVDEICELLDIPKRT